MKSAFPSLVLRLFLWWVGGTRKVLSNLQVPGEDMVHELPRYESTGCNRGSTMLRHRPPT